LNVPARYGFAPQGSNRKNMNRTPSTVLWYQLSVWVLCNRPCMLLIAVLLGSFDVRHLCLGIEETEGLWRVELFNVYYHCNQTKE
jgi:hypothetical protein